MSFNGWVEAAFTVPSSTTFSVTTNASSGAIAVAAGEYSGITAFCAYLATAMQTQRPVSGGVWQVSVSTGASGTGKITIAVTNGNLTISWGGATNIRTLLGFTGDVGSTTTTTATKHARGLWIPDCPLNAKGDLRQAPLESDRRETVGPNGHVTTLRGTSRYVHRNLVWSLVAKNKVWRAEEVTADESYERFFLDAIEGGSQAFSWFTPGSKLIVTDHRGYAAGAASSVVGWHGVGIPGLAELKMASGSFTGLWRVEWPKIIAPGGV